MQPARRRWTRFATARGAGRGSRSASLISQLAREAATRWVRVDRDTFELLELCDEVTRQSVGAFDVAGTAELASWSAVELDPMRCAVRFSRAGVTLDLGGVGKGAALDLAARGLREAGVRAAFLHAGTSTALAFGVAPSGEPWRLGLPDGGSARARRRRALDLSRWRAQRRSAAVGAPRCVECARGLLASFPPRLRAPTRGPPHSSPAHPRARYRPTPETFLSASLPHDRPHSSHVPHRRRLQRGRLRHRARPVDSRSRARARRSCTSRCRGGGASGSRAPRRAREVRRSRSRLAVRHRRATTQVGPAARPRSSGDGRARRAPRLRRRRGRFARRPRTATARSSKPR